MNSLTKILLIFLSLGLNSLSFAHTTYKKNSQKVGCSARQYSQFFPGNEQDKELRKKQIQQIAHQVSNSFYELTKMNLNSDRRCSPVIQYKTAFIISQSQCLARAIGGLEDLKKIIHTKEFKKIQKVYSETISNLGNSSKYCQTTHKRDYASLLSQYQANFVLADLYSAGE